MNQHDRAAASDDIDIGALGAALWKNRYRIGAIVLTAGVLGYVGLSLLTPLYSAESRVLIEHEESAFTRPSVARDETRDVLLDQEAVESQVQVMLSRDLSAGVAKQLDLAANPEFNALQPGLVKRLLIGAGLAKPPSEANVNESVVNNFQEKLSVYQVAKSRVIAVDFTSQSPELSAKAANDLAEAYIGWQRNEFVGRTRDASDWLNRQIEELRLKVAASEEAAEKFRAEQGLYAGSNNVTLSTQQLSELNSQIIVAKAQRSEAEARAKLIKDMLKTRGDVDTASDVLKSETIGRLLEQRVTVQRQLAELSATLQPGHPRMRQLSSELSDLRRQIRDEAGKVVQGLENEAQIAGAREASLRGSLNEVKQLASSSSDDEIKLRALEREAKANRDLLESYLARHRDASARRDLGALPSNATVISRAHASSTPSFPRKGPLTGLIMAVAALLSAGVVLGRALLTPRAIVPEALPANPSARRLPPPSRAYTPPDKPSPVADDAESKTATETEDRAPRLRSLDAVMTQIHLRLSRQRPMELMVAAAHGSDAAADAVAIARALVSPTRSTILVDVSRAPSSIPSLFDLPRSPGYAELVSGAAEFEDIVRVDPKSALHVICAGGGLMGEGERTATLEVPHVLEALSAAYDAVILHADTEALSSMVELLGIDAPPTIVVSTRDDAAADDSDPAIEQLSREGRLVAVYDKAQPSRRKLGGIQLGNRAASF